MIRKYLWLLLLVVAISLVGAGYFSYQPPLLDRGGRNPLESIFDFFAYSWHFSRRVWMEEKRDWKSAGREKVLSAWYRPSIIESWGSLKDKSLFSLAWEYEKYSHLKRAVSLYFAAHLNDISDQKLAEKVAFRLSRLQAWDELFRVGQNMADHWPRHGGGRYWLKVARNQALPEK